MKKYNININGKSYEVEVEEVGGSTLTSGTNYERESSPPQPTPKAVKEPIKQEINNEPPQGAETISAPMPGNILDVNVKVGDIVSEGDTLLILEAMKMENEIMAPRDGKIVGVNASKGQTVDTGDSLISLE